MGNYVVLLRVLVASKIWKGYRIDRPINMAWYFYESVSWQSQKIVRYYIYVPKQAFLCGKKKQYRVILTLLLSELSHQHPWKLKINIYVSYETSKKCWSKLYKAPPWNRFHMLWYISVSDFAQLISSNTNLTKEQQQLFFCVRHGARLQNELPLEKIKDIRI